MQLPRILLADDHRLVAEGLARLLVPEFELVAIVEDGVALIEAAQRLQPDLILADVSMPRLNGIDALEQLRAADCRAAVLFLTMHCDPIYAARALHGGAGGYVLKHAAPDELLTAIRAVLAGGTYVSPAVAALLERAQERSASVAQPAIMLTPRQREVLQLVAEGKTARQIAQTLFISVRTAEGHRANLMGLFGASGTLELIKRAAQHGFVSTA